MKDQLVLGALGLLPKNALSRAVGRAAHAAVPPAIGRASVAAFARMYGLDLDEAEHPIEHYPNVGALFTRRLRSGARPIDASPATAVSPADGRILNSGRMVGRQLIQAKGRRFHLEELLRHRPDAERFASGSWVTVYLSPRDYHRVHHPVEGTIIKARYVPGHLWPVNRGAVEHVNDLFCVNERVITYTDSPLGPVATIMVGATSVGHITMAYDDALVTNRERPAEEKTYSAPIPVARGDELGTFNLGSTAIVLFADPAVELLTLVEGESIRMGVPIARRRDGMK